MEGQTIQRPNEKEQERKKSDLPNTTQKYKN